MSKSMKMLSVGSKRNLLLVLALTLVIPLLGLSAGFSTKIGVYIIGALGGIAYLILALVQPFAAFCILILFGLTVRISGIQLLPGISLMIAVGGLFLVGWLVRAVVQNSSLTWVKEFWYVIGLAFVILISTLFNWGGPAGFIPVFTYIQLLLLPILVVNFANSPKQLNQIGYIFIIASTFMAVAILLDQWGFLSVGFTSVLESGVVTSNRFETFERSGGLLGDPNITALQLTIALPFVIEYWFNSSKYTRFWLSVAAITISVAFLYTVSLGGMLGIVSILLIKTLLVRRSNFLIRVIQMVSIGWIGVWLFLNFLPNYYLDRVSINVEQITSFLQAPDKKLFLQLGSTRGDAWLATIKTFLHSPIIGNGPGNAYYISPLYSVLWHPSSLLAAHNFLLAFASDLGTLGLFFFLSLLIAAIWIVRPLQQHNLQNLQPVRNAIFIALLACMVQGMALDLHIQKLLWILIGMALVYKRLANLSQKTSESNENAEA